jgi:hypothetical protein
MVSGTRSVNNHDGSPGLLRWTQLKTSLVRNPALLLVPVLLIIAVFQGRNDQVEGLFLWTIASFSIGQAAAVIGPIGAGLAVYLAGRNASGATGIVLHSMPDRGSRVHVLSVVATLIWVVGAWCLYILYQFVVGSIYSDWGSLEAMPVLSGFSILPMAVTAGYTLGVYFPGRYTPIFVGTGMFLSFILVYLVGNDSPQLDWLGVYESAPGAGSESSIKYLSPMQIFSGSVSNPVSTSWATVGPRFIGWMLGIAVTAIGMLGWRLGLRIVGVSIATLGIAASAIAAGALLSLPASVAELPREDVAYEELCDGDIVQVCVHPAYRQNLRPTLKIAEAVLGPIQGLSGVPTNISQFGTSSGGERVYQIYFDNSTIDQVAMNYLGVLYDLSGGELSPGQSVIGYALFTRAVDDPDGYWLGLWLPSAEFWDGDQAPHLQLQDSVNQWDALSQAQQREWLEANWTSLINGEIGWAELP